MRGRGACQLDEIRRCTFDLEANLARRDHHGRNIVHALVKHGRERLFHADRRAAAAYIAGKAQQFLDMHHLDRIFACRLGCFFQVKLLCDRIIDFTGAICKGISELKIENEEWKIIAAVESIRRL